MVLPDARRAMGCAYSMSKISRFKRSPKKLQFVLFCSLIEKCLLYHDIEGRIYCFGGNIGTSSNIFSKTNGISENNNNKESYNK